MTQQPPPQPPQQPGPTPPPSGYPPAAWGAPGQPPAWLPPHPRSNHALLLGVVAVSGFLACGLTLAVGPFAWAEGVRVRREIDAEPWRYGGRGEATTAIVCGIVSTVALVLGILAIGAVAAVFVLGATGSL